MARAHLLCPLLLLAGALGAQETQADFFGLDKLWDIHIEVSRDAWLKLYPPPSTRSTRMFTTSQTNNKL